MRIWVAVGLAVLLGVGTGVGSAMLKLRIHRWDGTPEGASAEVSLPRPKGPGGLLPEAVVEEDTHDFGVMDTNQKKAHDFVIKNVGRSPLLLKKGATSCRCASTVLEEGEIAPGGSGKVRVQWTGKGIPGPFTETARVETNDPKRPRIILKIKGRITVAVRAVPPQPVLTRITAGESATAQVRVFGFRSEPLEITEYGLSDPTTAHYFDVTYQAIPPEEAKKLEEDATSGQLVQITVKPGLPLGAFQQTIRLKTNFKEASTVEVPIRGTIGSEISVFGKGWNRTTGVLTLGRVKSQDGIQHTLFIRAGGPHGKEVSLKPVKIYPDLLHVELGKTSFSEDSETALTSLIIQIPKGSRPAVHLGSEEGELGQITLESSHPKPLELRILVRFVVEG